MVVSGSAVTVHGTETIKDEYTIDVDHEPLRLVFSASYTDAIADQYAHSFTGSHSPIVALRIFRNGTRVPWADRANYSYRVKFSEGDWGDYVAITYNTSGSAISMPAGVPVSIQLKYENGGTLETSAVYTFDISRNDTPDTDITISSATEGLTIDNENRTITGTFAADAEITLAAAYTTEITQGNVHMFFCGKRLFQPTLATTTAGVLSAATIARPAVKIGADDPFIYGVDYTVNITITE